jgi:8-oxo-dGTP diphosphatase
MFGPIHSGAAAKSSFDGAQPVGSAVIRVYQQWTNPALPRNLTAMSHRTPRIAVRALVVQDDRLLLVNAYRGGVSDLWCAPGGGAMVGQSLPANLKREMWEETGLRVMVGQPCLVNEFHDPVRGFHQVDVYFRCTIAEGALNDAWRDPEGVVTRRLFFSRA